MKPVGPPNMIFPPPNRSLIWLFSFVWQHWLTDRNVIKVHGWRTAIVEHKTLFTRETISPCFWWFQ